MYSRRHDALKRYANLVCCHKVSVTCQLCRATLPAKEMEPHLLSAHGDRFPDGHRCPWCLGEYAWPPRQKYRHAKHLKECFVARNNPEVRRSEEESTSNDYGDWLRCWTIQTWRKGADGMMIMMIRVISLIKKIVERSVGRSRNNER